MLLMQNMQENTGKLLELVVQQIKKKSKISTGRLFFNCYHPLAGSLLSFMLSKVSWLRVKKLTSPVDGFMKIMFSF